MVLVNSLVRYRLTNFEMSSGVEDYIIMVSIYKLIRVETGQNGIPNQKWIYFRRIDRRCRLIYYLGKIKYGIHA